MTDYLTKAFRIPQLRKKIIITLAVLAIFRFLAHVPVPNVNTESLKLLFESNQLLGFVNIFTGGGLENLSIVALSVSPYITASIIIQVLTMAVPKLEELSKEGAMGRQRLSQYTQSLTLPVALIQSYGVYFLLRRQEVAGTSILQPLSPLDLLILILTLTAGTFFLIWIANIITEYGVGQGVSVIIFAGIIAGIPLSFGNIFAGVGDTSQLINGVIILGVFLFVITGVVFVNEAYRKIEIQYSSKVRGSKVIGGGNSFIPIKINQAGVIPIIFAVSLILVPNVLGGYLQSSTNEVLSKLGIWLSINFSPTSLLYNLTYFLLVFGFTYFYTSVTFNPEKIAEDIRKNGGFIPGIRPGKATIEHLKYVINRLTLAGGVFLGIVAILPTIVQGFTGIASLAIGGTGLLIVVSVVLETVKQIESQVITREYEGFTR